MEITGDEGVVHVPNMWVPGSNAHYTVRREGRADEVVAVDGDQIVHMIDGFSRAVLDGKSVPADPEEAVATLRVLDALAKSARDGAGVDVKID
jgi:predicted dehydrogenase